MSDEEQPDSETGREDFEAKFIEFTESCLDGGWMPTRCPQACAVEPDGICPHALQKRCSRIRSGLNRKHKFRAMG